MKKSFTVLSLVAMCMFATACEKAEDTAVPTSTPASSVPVVDQALEANKAHTAKLVSELEKITPVDFIIGLRAPLFVSDDGQGIVLQVALKEKMFDATKEEQLAGFRKGVSASIQNVFCTGTAVADPMKRYMTNGQYIDFRMVDENSVPLFDIKMDEGYCSSNAQVQPLSPEEMASLIEKQKNQGFYDDEYLNKVIITNYRTQLPQAMTSELSVTDLSAANGVLTYHVEYTPNNGQANPMMIKALLKTLPENTCGLAPVQTLLKNIKAMVYSVESAGTPVDSITITLESCNSQK